MITLTAEKRTITGKAVNALRTKGILPAVVYGKKTEPQSISVSMKDFGKALAEAGESSLIALSLEGTTHNVLIQDVLLDPLTEKLLHADFLAVQMDQELETKVSLEFVGESPAVKNEGGILVKVMHDMEIAALPKDLPPAIEIDISQLTEIGARITLGEVTVPAGVRALGDPDEVVVLVEAPRSEEELAELETKAAAPVAEVVTEREEEAKKKAESATEVEE